jgi:hypothetical protein
MTYIIKQILNESGVAGADRVKSRNDFQQFLTSYKNLISRFPGFVSLQPSGSYNSNLEKQDFGDIDLIVHITSDKDKAQVKKELQAFLHNQPDTVIVPFSSEKHAGKRSYNAGELVSVRYHDDQLGYSAQIDNIVALDHKEVSFKQKFLDMPAEKQGLVLGLVKIAAIETDPVKLFKELNINVTHPVGPNQEYEFNVSSVKLELRLVTYEPGTFKQVDKTVLWSTQNWESLEKLLYQYDLSQSFDELLARSKSIIKNPRSNNRMQGVFSSMITVKSGEIGTAKGAGKENALAKVQQTFKESRSLFRSLMETSSPNRIVIAFGRFQPPTVGHELIIKTVKETAERLGCPYAIFVSKKVGTTPKPKLRDPLTIDQKMHFLNKFFPGTNFVAATDTIRTPVEAAKALNQKYNEIVFVAGADRKEIKDLLDQYNHIDYNYNKIDFVSSGERDPDADGVAGVSGTDVRQAAANNDFDTFKQNLPTTASEEDAMQLMELVRTGMMPTPKVSKKPESKNKMNTNPEAGQLTPKESQDGGSYAISKPGYDGESNYPARPNWRGQNMGEDNSKSIADTAKRLANTDDGKVAKLRAAGDKKREQQLKYRDMVRRNDEGVTEGSKLDTAEKLKRNLKRGGFDMDAAKARIDALKAKQDEWLKNNPEYAPKPEKDLDELILNPFQHKPEDPKKPAPSSSDMRAYFAQQDKKHPKLGPVEKVYHHPSEFEKEKHVDIMKQENRYVPLSEDAELAMANAMLKLLERHLK